jgi:hypothetical protein
MRYQPDNPMLDSLNSNHLSKYHEQQVYDVLDDGDRHQQQV